MALDVRWSICDTLQKDTLDLLRCCHPCQAVSHPAAAGVHLTFSCRSGCLWLASSTTATMSPRLSDTGASTDTHPGFCATVTRFPVERTFFISGIISW